MISAVCCSFVLITMAVLFICSSVVLFENAQGSETAWIVNGTSINSYPSCVHESCHDVYTVRIHGFKYVNSTVSNYCIYKKYYQNEDDAKECKNHYVDGSVHHWEHDNHECFTETHTIIIALILMIIGIFLASGFMCILTSNLYNHYKKHQHQQHQPQQPQNTNTDNNAIEIPLMTV